MDSHGVETTRTFLEEDELHVDVVVHPAPALQARCVAFDDGFAGEEEVG